MDLVRTGRLAEAGFKLRDKNRIRSERLDLIRESLVETLNDRHHEDDCGDGHTDTKNRQRRAQLVSPQSVERHQRGFFNVFESHKTIQLLMLRSGRVSQRAMRATARSRSPPPTKHQHPAPPKPHSPAAENRSAPKSHKQVQTLCPRQSTRQLQSPSPLRSKTASGCRCDARQSLSEYRSLSCALSPTRA